MNMGAKQIQDSAVKGKSNQTSGIRLPDYLVIKKAIHIENKDFLGMAELLAHGLFHTYIIPSKLKFYAI